MTATDKLLPCPFCGWKANLVSDTPTTFDETKYGFGCSNPECLCYTGYGVKLFPSEKEAGAAWNKRHRRFSLLRAH